MKKVYEKPELNESMNGTLEGVYACYGYDYNYSCGGYDYNYNCNQQNDEPSSGTTTVEQYNTNSGKESCWSWKITFSGCWGWILRWF